jgi:hypothetical protein
MDSEQFFLHLFSASEVVGVAQTTITVRIAHLTIQEHFRVASVIALVQ